MLHRGDLMIKQLCFTLVIALAASSMALAEDSSEEDEKLLPPPPVQAPKEMSKNQTDSCNAVLCLAGGESLSECVEPLNIYYDLKPKKRPEFLKVCPKD